MSNILAKLIFMKYKSKENIREYIMEVSNLTAKLKSLKLELDEDLIVHLVLISLPTHFGKFKMNYNPQKDKWSLNELISHCVQEEERVQRDKTESAHFALTSQNKKKKNIKNAMKGSSKGNKPKKNEEFTCFFRKKSRHMKKQCPKYVVWHVKKGKFLSLICFEINLTFVLVDTWWVDSGATTHIRFPVELTVNFDKFVFSYSFGNNKVSLCKNSNVVGSSFLVDNLSMLNVVSSHNKILQIGSRVHISKQRIQRLVLDEILEPLNLSNFKKIKAVKSNCGDEYYGRYDEFGEQRPGPFALFLRKCEIVLQYTMPGKPSMNGVTERRNWTFKDMLLWGEALKTTVYIFNRVPTKAINKTPYELWTDKKPTKARPYRPHEKKLNSRTINCYFVGYVECSEGYKFYDPTSRYFFKMGNVRILEEVEFEKEENIRNVVFEEEFEDDISLIEDDPINFCQAMQSYNSQKWIDSMKDELKYMQGIDIWDLVELLEGVKPIGCKCIFETKKDSKGNIERYKARLVSKGFTQKESIDYKETFSPVSSKDSFKIIMALVAHFDLELHQMEVKTAFLNGDIDEMIYMFHQVITSYGFKTNVVDDCIYHKFSWSKYIFLVLYVDDILLVISEIGSLRETKRFLTKNFEMKDLGEASFVLGIQILRDRSQGILRLSQENYINKVLDRFGIKDSKPGDTLIAKGDKFSIKQCPNNDLERNEMQKIPYASVVGSLMYTQVCTCPNIAFMVGVLGMYLSDPRMQHWKAVKCMICYLKRTKGYMLTYRKFKGLEIIMYLILQDVKTANSPHLDTTTCWLEKLSL
ncbi:hypothetical protein CR513_00311, partial [Mucuna pruriens]